MNRTRARLLATAAVVATAVAATLTGSAAVADGPSTQSFFFERLSGYEETPLALSTSATGQLRLQINERAQEITYRLSYTALEGGNITQAHVHFGAPAQTGGISFFLCTNQGNGPAGTQACPAAPATITGTIRPADVIGPAAQGIAAGEFNEIVAAIRAGLAYVNVHSTAFPVGEIRGQFGHH